MSIDRKQFNSEEYLLPRDWIKNKREQGWEWNRILDKNDNFFYVQNEDNDWPLFTKEEWKALVSIQKEDEDQRLTIAFAGANLSDGLENNNVEVPTYTSYSDTAWSVYVDKLKENGFSIDTINQIRDQTLKIARQMSVTNSVGAQARKGLVIGNVQSGKTANMEALMALCADNGWNMFIILSGTIENLRQQTSKRIYNDLCSGNYSKWKVWNNTKLSMNNLDERLQDFNIDAGFKSFTVCLKNPSRLKDLLKWINMDQKTKSKLNLVIIDDEGDQASINTNKLETKNRTRINNYILNLVNGLNEKGEKTQFNYNSVNYVAYTATPYANILNESGVETLYPKSFINCLPISNEYFGPEQIFGIDEDNEEEIRFPGLNIIREVSKEEIDRLKKQTLNSELGMPAKLEEAICWFIDCVACQRLIGYRKPVSMLIHTSQKTNDHENIQSIVENWFKSSTSDLRSIENLIEKCKNIWDKETNEFKPIDFKNQYEEYGYPCPMQSYPSFEQIRHFLDDLINKKTRPIYLNEDKEPEFGNGIHLCVDNFTNNRADTDGSYLRLIYPEKDSMPDLAPAFLVIGGATLSRGLTIEGLVSTYFIRSVTQADTLMQMGRWFGYRKGYELLPRLWLGGKVWEQFLFLSQLDIELRNQIILMEHNNISPSEYGPKVKNTPKYSFIRITARNRSQSAKLTDFNFMGSSNQTFLFEEHDIEHNLITTKEFINSLGIPSTARNDITQIWRNVEFSKVKGFMNKYKAQKNMTFFANQDSFLQWIEKSTEKGRLGPWNVLLAGTRQGKKESLEYVDIRKVTRTRKIRENTPFNRTVIDMGALASPKDLIGDIDFNILNDEQRKAYEECLKNNLKDKLGLREKCDLETTPLLVLYIVDKDSKARNNTKNRTDLNVRFDIAGFAVVVPGGKQGVNYQEALHIPMVRNDLFNEED